MTPEDTETAATPSGLRLGLESYSPFFDRDVIDGLVRIPMVYRSHHRLYLRTLQRSHEYTRHRAILLV